MNSTLRIAIALCLVPSVAVLGQPPEWVARARSAAAELASGLMPALHQAMSSGGPMAAVKVCNVEAPEIAEAVSQPDLQIGRTALRLRNPDNAPNQWERETLLDFEQRLAQGADPAGLEWWTIDERQGRMVGRWMKAITTAPLCTTCHGENIDPELAKTIARLYPEDRATGFRVGELRGAFTVEVELPGKP